MLDGLCGVMDFELKHFTHMCLMIRGIYILILIWTEGIKYHDEEHNKGSRSGYKAMYQEPSQQLTQDYQQLS